ncbi:MAG: hypothetical protein AB2L07_02865 [Thermoanaerobaculaceae bacterium]
MDPWLGPLAVDVPEDEVRRALGYGGHGRPSRAVAARLHALWPAAIGLLRPRGCCRPADAETARAAGLPNPEGPAVLALCTIGPELEAESARRQADGATLDALVLDSIGSAAAEAAADALNAVVCERLVPEGLHAAPRESPGYGDWPVTCQRELLALLPAAELGVVLSPGLMMIPRKSVSFAVRLVDRPLAATSQCERCGLLRCRHRTTAPRPEVP